MWIGRGYLPIANAAGAPPRAARDGDDKTGTKWVKKHIGPEELAYGPRAASAGRSAATRSRRQYSTEGDPQLCLHLLDGVTE